MRLIYVAGPYRASDAYTLARNVAEARRVGFAVAQAGAVPVIPHTMYHHYDRTLTDEYWLEATQDIMRTCDAMVLCPRWRRSEGTLAEIDAFRGPIFESLTDLQSWLKR